LELKSSVTGFSNSYFIDWRKNIGKKQSNVPHYFLSTAKQKIPCYILSLKKSFFRKEDAVVGS
jgi:hypothetical protein